MRPPLGPTTGALAARSLATILALAACGDATPPVAPPRPAPSRSAAEPASAPAEVTAGAAVAAPLAIDATNARVGAGLLTGPYRVTLAAAAPAGGTTVTLASGNPAALQLSPTGATAGAGSIAVLVSQGNTQATFFLQGVEGQADTTTITASASGLASATATNVVVAPAIVEILGLAASTPSVAADDPFEVRVGAANATGTGLAAEQPVRPGRTLAVAVASTAPAVARLQLSGGAAASGTLSILAGASRSGATVATGGVALDPMAVGTTTITASSAQTLEAPGATRAVSVTAPTIRLNATGARVGSGLVAGPYSVVLDGPAPAGGVPVTLTSGDGTLLQLAPGAATTGAPSITLTVPAGQTNGYFHLQGVEARTGTTTIAASAPNFGSGSAGDVGVATPLVALVGLDPAPTPTSPDDPFQVRVGLGNAAGTLVATEQPVRPGAGLAVTVSNASAAVGRLVFAAGAAQRGTVTIPAGQSRSATTVAAGGVAFDPLAAGTTTVAAASAATGEASDASVAVAVGATGLATTVANAVVGSGLVEGSYAVRLATPAPAGGVAVTLTSSNGALLQLAKDAATAGAPTIALTIPQGQTAAYFHIQGVEGQSGTAGITVSAPGYTPVTATPVRVVTPAIDLVNLDAAPTTISPDDPFQVRVGVANSSSSGVGIEQEVRPGGSLRATVTNGTGTVARLAVAAGVTQSASVVIPAGQSRSPATVAAGGVALDPLAAGTTTVAATSAAALETQGATRAVRVAPPAITLNTAGARVGAGLTYGSFTVRLGAPAVGAPAVVTLTSSVPGVLQLAPTATAAGAGSITVTIPVGLTTASFHVQGVEGQRGIATITATAAGYASGASTAEVVAPVIDLVGVPTSLAASAPNAVVQVRVGAGNSTATFVSTEQPVRAGGSLAVRVSNDAAAVARLVSGATTGQAVSLTIPAGASRTASSATTGVALDPLAAGATVVRATSTAALPGTNAARGVTVTP